MKTELKQFPCSMCSQCCRHIGVIVKQKEIFDEFLQMEIAAFPYRINDDGSCSNLDSDGKCKVYETRPKLCRMNWLYRKIYRKEFSREEFFQMQATSCNGMIKAAGLDDKYLVKLPGVSPPAR